MLIDAGNSRIKWAWLKAEKLGKTTPVAYEGNDESDDKAQVVKLLLEAEKPKKISMVHVLGDKFEQDVRDHCKMLSIECRIFTSNLSCGGVTNGYDIPEQLGADRFVALIGAHHLLPNDNLLVIDTGTAVTIDGISKKGKHLGGLILPGLQLWPDTLIKNTQLSPISIETDAEVFATNTKRGINSGSIHGLSGAINQICRVMESNMTSELNLNKTKRVLCGGDSRLLANYLSGNASEKYILISDLVMHGLAAVYKNEQF